MSRGPHPAPSDRVSLLLLATATSGSGCRFSPFPLPAPRPCFSVAPGNSHFREKVQFHPVPPPRPSTASARTQGSGLPATVSRRFSAATMVLLHVKRGDESQFLLQAPGSSELEELTAQVARVYNARLKAQRLCSGAAQRRGAWEGRENWACGGGAKLGGTRQASSGGLGATEGQAGKDFAKTRSCRA